MKNDPFRALGVDVTASNEQIKAAYRDLAWRLHPDRVATKTPAEVRLAERRMREVNEAWETIGTPERRAEYEAARRAARPGANGRPKTARSGPAAGPSRPSSRPGESAREPLRDWRAYAPGGVAAEDGQALASASADDEDLVDAVGDQHFWLFRGLVPVVIVVTLLIIVVATAFAGGLSSPSDPTTSAGVGDCALGNRLVACDQPHDARVMGVAAADGTCPRGQIERTLAQAFCVVNEN